MEVTDRIAQLLRETGAPLISLGQLRRHLASREEVVSGEETLRGILAARPDRFILLERPNLFAGAEHWPSEERAAYAEALSAAGFDTQPLVGPAAPEESVPEGGEVEDASPAAQIAASLAQIATAAEPEGQLRETLWDSLPMAEATMRVLAEAWQARKAAMAAEG